MILTTLLILVLCVKLQVTWTFRQESNGLNPKELIVTHGYPLEIHSVHTEDGYILETHRIPHGIRTKNVEKKSVLIMPGVMSSSAIWLDMGPRSSLGFILADAGYDVWLANYRGSTWSRKHTTLDPDKNEKQFYDFSYQEIGYYDIPANIDYILNITNQEKLFYIGHSQGTTTFFAMGADRPEYNEKIRLMSALAPVAYTAHLDNIFFDIVGKHINSIEIIFNLLGLHEFLPYNPWYKELAEYFCDDHSLWQPVCQIFLKELVSRNIDASAIPVIASNVPAGTSSRSFLHTVQQTNSKKFEHYDFGFMQNIIKYGQKYPPEYDVTKITAPVALYYSTEDSSTPAEDLARLISELPNVVDKKNVEGYTHVDFIWARNVNTTLYDDIIQVMDMF